MVWGKPAAGAGAWANAVEEEEQEHGAIQAPAAMPEQEFPSLGAAATIKETKKDKKKKQTMSLGDFMSSGSGRQFADPVLDLPTAPRARAEGEERETGPTLGGGFRGYGGDRYGGGGGRGGRFDDEERRPRRQRDEEDLGPSRADAVDNWGAERKFVPSDDRGHGGREGGFRDRGFGGGFRDRDDRPPRRDFEEGPSRADTADWGAKQFVPSDGPPKRYDEPRGGGFRDREFREPSRADVEDRWERRGDVKPTGFDDRPRRPFDEAPRERRGFSESWRGRERENLSGPSSRDGSRDVWRKEAPAGGDDEGAAKERPKLVLKPRTASADARAASEASRPSIFGAARPREDVLKEQGRDPIKEEERLDAAAKASLKSSGKKEREAKESEEEVALKAKIAEAQKKAEEAAEGEDKDKAAEEVAALEAELAKLKVEAEEKAAANRGRGGGGSRAENGRSSRGGGERSGSQRRESGGGGGGNRRRNDDRETSRNRASGERW